MTETTPSSTTTRRRFLATAAGVVPAAATLAGPRRARAQKATTLTLVVPEHWKVTEGIQQKSPATVQPRRLWYYERIMEWEKAHPDIKLEHQSVTWDQIAPKFIAASLAGNPPDILTVDGNELPALATGGFLHPLNEFRLFGGLSG